MNMGSLTDLLAGASIPLVAVALVLGLVNCFFGYKLFRVMLVIYGFLLGAGAGVFLAGVLLEGEGWIAIAAAVVGGIVGAVLMSALYYVGVFVVGALAGAMFLGALGASLDFSMPVLAVIVGAIVTGIVAILLQRAVLIMATAFSGAWVAIMGGTALLEGSSFTLTNLRWVPPVWQRSYVPLIIWLVLGIGGAVVQFRTTGE